MRLPLSPFNYYKLFRIGKCHPLESYKTTLAQPLNYMELTHISAKWSWLCVFTYMACWRVMVKRRQHHDQSLYFPITPASISLIYEVNPPPRQGQSPEKW